MAPALTIRSRRSGSSGTRPTRATLCRPVRCDTARRTTMPRPQPRDPTEGSDHHDDVRRTWSNGPLIVIVMGVTGSGKTMVGRAVAPMLGVPFLDGDDYHSVAARQRMAAGEALTDADRRPWLDRL